MDCSCRCASQANGLSAHRMPDFCLLQLEFVRSGIFVPMRLATCRAYTHEGMHLKRYQLVGSPSSDFQGVLNIGFWSRPRSGSRSRTRSLIRSNILWGLFCLPSSGCALNVVANQLVRETLTYAGSASSTGMKQMPIDLYHRASCARSIPVSAKKSPSRDLRLCFQVHSGIEY